MDPKLGQSINKMVIAIFCEFFFNYNKQTNKKDSQI